MVGAADGQLILRRGGLLPASPAQERCDGCGLPLMPPTATELTVTTPSRTVRLYAHGEPMCVAAIVDRARAAAG